jgi:hypothetical protein
VIGVFSTLTEQEGRETMICVVMEAWRPTMAYLEEAAQLLEIGIYKQRTDVISTKHGIAWHV